MPFLTPRAPAAPRPLPRVSMPPTTVAMFRRLGIPDTMIPRFDQDLVVDSLGRAAVSPDGSERLVWLGTQIARYRDTTWKATAVALNYPGQAYPAFGIPEDFNRNALEAVDLFVQTIRGDVPAPAPAPDAAPAPLARVEVDGRAWRMVEVPSKCDPNRRDVHVVAPAGDDGTPAISRCYPGWPGTASSEGALRAFMRRVVAAYTAPAAGFWSITEHTTHTPDGTSRTTWEVLVANAPADDAGALAEVQARVETYMRHHYPNTRLARRRTMRLHNSRRTQIAQTTWTFEGGGQ